MFLVIRYAVIKMQALARGHKVSVKKIITKWKFKVTGGEVVQQNSSEVFRQTEYC